MRWWELTSEKKGSWRSEQHRGCWLGVKVSEEAGRGRSPIEGFTQPTAVAATKKAAVVHFFLFLLILSLLLGCKRFGARWRREGIAALEGLGGGKWFVNFFIFFKFVFWIWLMVARVVEERWRIDGIEKVQNWCAVNWMLQPGATSRRTPS